MDLVVKCYTGARRFPRSEVYGLASQLQRAAVSVPSNIAEGNGRASTGAYLRHLSIANGSLMEVETHIRVARRLVYFSEVEEQDLLVLSGEVGRMLSALGASLRGQRIVRSASGSRFPVPGS
jgi:four helix bundle protein